MPSYTPTITTNATSFLSITSTDVTYDEIKNSLGSYVYGITDIYITANTLRQILQPFAYQQYDSNGNQTFDSFLFMPDPYQFKSAFIQKLEEGKMIFDGRSSLSFTVLPSETLKISFYYLLTKFAQGLDEFHPDNFKEIWDFFSNYVDVIE